MIPLASAAISSISLLDYLLWGVVALVVQLLLFAAVKIYMPRISDKIEANHGRRDFLGASPSTAAC